MAERTKGKDADQDEREGLVHGSLIAGVAASGKAHALGTG